MHLLQSLKVAPLKVTDVNRWVFYRDGSGSREGRKMNLRITEAVQITKLR